MGSTCCGGKSRGIVAFGQPVLSEELNTDLLTARSTAEAVTRVSVVITKDVVVGVGAFIKHSPVAKGGGTVGEVGNC